MCIRDSGVFALWGGVGLSMLTASVVQLAVLLRLDWRDGSVAPYAGSGKRGHRDGGASEFYRLVAERMP